MTYIDERSWHADEWDDAELIEGSMIERPRRQRPRIKWFVWAMAYLAMVGIVVALTFIGLPFVVRTVQPVLQDLEPEIEDAAAVLGAGRMATLLRVVLPGVLPALATGFALAFARGLGEYGSVVFIAGNMPMVSEITPLLIMIKLEQYDYAGATSIALVFLVVSFAMLLAVNALARRGAARLRAR